MIEIRMTGNLLRGSRMNGVILPGDGGRVRLPEPDAAELVRLGHAAVVEDSEPERRVVAPPERRTPTRKPRRAPS